MTERMREDGQNLTGVWHGLFTYATGQSVSFVATVIESGSHLGGSTHEPCVASVCPSATVYASLSGGRQGNSVTFVKSYDGGAGPDYQNPVAYDGMLNGDATEIEGRWRIRGLLAGRFLMIRSSGKAEAVERKAHQRA